MIADVEFFVEKLIVKVKWVIYPPHLRNKSKNKRIR